MFAVREVSHVVCVFGFVTFPGEFIVVRAVTVRVCSFRWTGGDGGTVLVAAERGIIWLVLPGVMEVSDGV